MAAQAVDFTVSGHINRAVVITDCDPFCSDDDMSSSTTRFGDNGSSGTRVRIKGSSETMSGVTASVNLELGVNSEAAAEKHVTVRHSVVTFGGEFGSIGLGRTSDAADGVTYNTKFDVFGIAHGQDAGHSRAADYVPGMGGGRGAGIHFTSAPFGPATIAFSAMNYDFMSARLDIEGDAGVAAYKASVAFMDTGKDRAVSDKIDYQEISGSLGVKLATASPSPLRAEAEATAWKEASYSRPSATFLATIRLA